MYTGVTERINGSLVTEEKPSNKFISDLSLGDDRQHPVDDDGGDDDDDDDDSGSDVNAYDSDAGGGDALADEANGQNGFSESCFH